MDLSGLLIVDVSLPPRRERTIILFVRSAIIDDFLRAAPRAAGVRYAAEDLVTNAPSASH